MYYHCRPLRHAEHGKVFPYDDPDGWLFPAYRWLGRYCGYCPQVWLSRGDIGMTGYTNRPMGKAPKREEKDAILFGFDVVRGFPIDHTFWCGCLLNTAVNMPAAGVADVSRRVAANLDEDVRELMEDDRQGFESGKYPLWDAWARWRPDFDAFLKAYVFVERDQVVVPSLNLKAAKKVVCRDERQRKALRRMGFIEDRIEIRNLPR